MYKTMPKLPAKLLRNYAPDGPLYTIASECGKLMKAKGLKRVDWQSPSTRKEVGAGAAGGPHRSLAGWSGQLGCMHAALGGSHVGGLWQPWCSAGADYQAVASGTAPLRTVYMSC